MKSTVKKQMKQLFEKTQKISNADTRPGDIATVAAKLSEESGEVAAECLKLTGFKPLKFSETKGNVTNRLKWEIGDATISLFDIAHRAGLTYEDLQQAIAVGLDKWEKYPSSQD